MSKKFGGATFSGVKSCGSKLLSLKILEELKFLGCQNIFGVKIFVWPNFIWESAFLWGQKIWEVQILTNSKKFNSKVF